MYQPSHFQPRDDAQCLALVRAHPLATLVVPTAAGLLANPLPMLLREGPDGLLLVGHVARANPLWQTPAQGDALAVFSGAQGYVSPGWYPSKAEHGKVVPTWNYATVHAHGPLRFIDDAAWLRALVEALTQVHEAAQRTPWKVADAPADYIERMVASIIGVELRVIRLEGKFKLSQNRPAADRAGVLAALDDATSGGDPAAAALAQAMRRI